MHIAAADKAMYVTRAVKRGNIDGDTFMDEAAEDSTLSKASVRAASVAMAQQFRELLFRGYNVEVPGVGTFRVSVRATAQEKLESAGAGTVTSRRILYTPCTTLRKALAAEDFTTEYGNATDGIFKRRSVYAASLGQIADDAETDVD